MMVYGIGMVEKELSDIRLEVLAEIGRGDPQSAVNDLVAYVKAQGRLTEDLAKSSMVASMAAAQGKGPEVAAWVDEVCRALIEDPDDREA